MDRFAKVNQLSQDMKVEVDSVQECHPVVEGRSLPEVPITELSMPGGKKMRALKTMLTTACERNCYYCPFRAGRNMRRQTAKPEEMARTYMDYYEVGMVEGLFLSSGIIKGGVTTQDKLLDTADILRNKYDYRGYLHLKLMPGLEKDQVRRAMQLASRVSTNLEAANEQRMPELAPMKQFTEELLNPLKWAQEIRQNEPPRGTWNGRWASTITQFVVGAAGESDLELLATSDYLYNQLGLSRTYYSSFRPIADTPLEGHPPDNPIRAHRLYQSSFLMRDYGWSLEDMPFHPDGTLPLNQDPKTAWAEQYLLHQPIELNEASREQLMMVPGIGPKSAMEILKARRQRRLTSLDDLRRLGVSTKRLKPYVLLNGRAQHYQMDLFEPPAPQSQVLLGFPG